MLVIVLMWFCGVQLWVIVEEDTVDVIHPVVVAEINVVIEPLQAELHQGHLCTGV